MTNIYKLKWRTGGNLGSESAVLSHKDKSREEFEKDVQEAAKLACEQMIEADPKNLVQDSFDIDFDDIDTKLVAIGGAEQLFDAVVNLLTNKMGYHYVHIPTVSLPYHGVNFSTFVDHHWESYLGKDLLEKLRKRIAELDETHPHLFKH